MLEAGEYVRSYCAVEKAMLSVSGDHWVNWHLTVSWNVCLTFVWDSPSDESRNSHPQWRNRKFKMKGRRPINADRHYSMPIHITQQTSTCKSLVSAEKESDILSLGRSQALQIDNVISVVISVNWETSCHQLTLRTSINSAFWATHRIRISLSFHRCVEVIRRPLSVQLCLL